MDSLPRSPVFDLCGEEPMALPPGRKQSAPLSLVEEKERVPLGEDLSRIIEGEIIPRLMLVHRSERPPAQRNVSPAGCIEPDLIEKFSLLSLSSGVDSLLSIVGALIERGVSVEDIYLELLGPAARRLGEYWEEDRVSFADVSIALGRLQHVVRELSLNGTHEVPASAGKAILFAPAPGEQHTFGLLIIEEFFRRSGWRTWAELSGSLTEIVSLVQTHHFDIFGMTVGSDEKLDLIAPMIMSVRKASRNRDITVLVGGRLFLERPELVTEVGADAMATDASQAVRVADLAVKRFVLG
jgi:methanogenic corrinoid protein MtbC1